MKKIGGVIPAIFTPFAKDGSVNTEQLIKLTEFNLAQGVSGFYVNGSTAENFLLTNEEKRRLLRAVRDIVNGRCTLIAHVGSISTAEACELAKVAEALGYHAVSAVAPFYYKFSFAEVKAYYYAIASSVSIPMVVYNFPTFSGVNLSADQIGEFLCDDRFLGVKHTSADYFAMRQFKTAYPDKKVFNGYDETFLAGLSMGADGAIGSTFNFMADKFIKIHELFLAGDIKAAMAVQEEADVIIAALCKCGVMQGEKAILCAQGLDFGISRPPFAPLSAEAEKTLLDTVLPLL